MFSILVTHLVPESKGDGELGIFTRLELHPVKRVASRNMDRYVSQ